MATGKVVRDSRSRIKLSIDWTQWLAAESTTISSSSWVVEGATSDSPAVSGSVASIFISGGQTGRMAIARNTITAANGLVDSRSVEIDNVDL